jgi:DNA-binding MarR family transcriptional regulator
MPQEVEVSPEAAALRYLAQRLARRLRRRFGDGFTASQLSALATVQRHEPIRPTDFARREYISKSTVTRAVAKLEAQGHVKRETDPDDARGYVIGLTPSGRQVLEEVGARQDAYLDRQLAALEPADLDAIRAALPALERLLAIRA